MKIKLITTVMVGIFLMTACKEKESTDKNEQVAEAQEAEKDQVDEKLEFIFPKGNLGPEENFTGKAYNYGLVAMDSTYTTLVGNVYFEPGARSNWHTHPAGQILIITDGLGYHQIEGQPIDTLKKGVVIKCPPNVKHWHGASANKGLQQMYIVPNTEKGVIEWMEPVTDEQYPKP